MRTHDERITWLNRAAELFVQGAVIDWRALYAGETVQKRHCPYIRLNETGAGLKLTICA